MVTPAIKIAIQLTNCKPTQTLRSMRYRVGHQGALQLCTLIYLTVKRLVEFYADSTELSTAEINAELEAALASLAKCKMTDELKGERDDLVLAAFGVGTPVGRFGGI